MTGIDVRAETLESRVNVLERCEELRSHLECTKDRLNQAAGQLEELTRIMVSPKPSSHEVMERPWLDELAFSQLIGDVMDAERRWAEARFVAAELGIALPPEL
jgi:hypothetical protein